MKIDANLLPYFTPELNWKSISDFVLDRKIAFQAITYGAVRRIKRN